MFRERRRRRQQLPEDECIEILNNNTSGVLAVSGDNGYPYAVPLSYVYSDGKIYFHCAPTGHKLDAVRFSDKASFCVIDRDEGVPERFTTKYKSVIAFGRARVMDEDEMRAAIELLADKYSPGVPGRQEEIEGALGRMRMLELKIEHMTGKEAIELTKERG